MYDPIQGRWLSEDPLGLDLPDDDFDDEQGHADPSNLYRFVGNDPINKRDPSGLADEDLYKMPENDIFYEYAYQKGKEVGQTGSLFPLPATHGFTTGLQRDAFNRGYADGARLTEQKRSQSGQGNRSGTRATIQIQVIERTSSKKQRCVTNIQYDPVIGYYHPDDPQAALVWMMGGSDAIRERNERIERAKSVAGGYGKILLGHLMMLDPFTATAGPPTIWAGVQQARTQQPTQSAISKGASILAESTGFANPQESVIVGEFTEGLLLLPALAGSLSKGTARSLAPGKGGLVGNSGHEVPGAFPLPADVESQIIKLYPGDGRFPGITNRPQYAGTNPFTGHIFVNGPYWDSLDPAIKSRVFFEEIDHQRRILSTPIALRPARESLRIVSDAFKFEEEFRAAWFSTQSFREGWKYASTYPEISNAWAAGEFSFLLYLDGRLIMHDAAEAYDMMTGAK